MPFNQQRLRDYTARLRALIDRLEELFIIIILGMMTIITLINVFLRYLFNSGILWGLEATVFLFAWLVIVGASYGVKKRLHLGIDILLSSTTSTTKKILGLISVSVCLIYAIMLLIGSIEYWYPFIDEQAFLETEDVPMPEWLQFLAAWLNEGERYEKLPRFIPYFALPLGMTLLSVRFIQAGVYIWCGRQDSIVKVHE